MGPSTDDQFNTIHLPLVPVACWKVEDVRFAFDSSFISADTDSEESPSDIREEFGHLQSLLEKYPDSPLSIFGHADPVGSDEYNKPLSGRRAMALYGLLIAQGDPDTAVSLWLKIAKAESWGSNQQGQMQAFTGLPAGTSGATLVKAYLQKLCPATLSLTKTNFLAQGADPDGRGDYQGCSEFNPLLIFSREKQDRFDQAKREGDTDGIAERNAANQPNRRVMVLLFRKGSVVLPSKWPCPSALVGIETCRGRFWSDGETRRSTHLPGEDRNFSDKEDTFACRFYQRITSTVPCERAKLGFATYTITQESDGKPVAQTSFEVRWPSGKSQRVKSDDGGVIVLKGAEGQVFDLIRLDDPKVSGAVSQNGPPLESGPNANT